VRLEAPSREHRLRERDETVRAVLRADLRLAASDRGKAGCAAYATDALIE